MTVQYAIVAFPILDTAAGIEPVRRRFDPLALLLPAHITLVFPFADAASDAEMATHIACAVADQRAFDITLADVSVEDGGFLFLNVTTGADVLGDLHDRLYTDLLASHLSSTYQYRPHITIGRLPDPEQLGLAAEEARKRLALPVRGKINDVALFRLDEVGRGAVTRTIGLVRGF